jgi:hypothetical protein
MGYYPVFSVQIVIVVQKQEKAKVFNVFLYFLFILSACNLNLVNGRANHTTNQLETHRDNRCDLQQPPIIQHIFMKIIKR